MNQYKRLSFILKLLSFAIVTVALYALYMIDLTPSKNIQLSQTVIEMPAGQTKRLIVTTQDKNIAYSSMNENIAVVDEEGKVTGIKSGITKVVVTTETSVATCEIIIEEPLEDILFDSISESVNVSETISISPILSSKVTNVSWSSSDPEIASVSKGTIEGKKAGTVVITARTNTNASANIMIVVKNIEVTNVSISKMKIELDVGEKETIYSYITPLNATIKDVKWTSSNPEIAVVNNGEIKALSYGTTTIRAESGDCYVECIVVVNKNTIMVTKFKIDRDSVHIKPNQTYTLNTVITPSNASNKLVKWESTNENIATVNDGIVTAKNIGITVITATLGNKSYSCVVTVTNEDYTSNYIKTLYKKTEYTIEEVQKYFDEVVLHVEYNENSTSHLVQKWNGPIYYYYNSFANEEDIKTIEKIVTELNKVPNFPQMIKTSIDKANFVINFSSYEAILNTTRELGVEGYAEFKYSEDSNIITRADIMISYELEQSIRNSVIIEEIVQALGLPADSKTYENSIFYQYASKLQWPSDIDWLLINILYNEQIKPGYNYSLASNIIKDIIK